MRIDRFASSMVGVVRGCCVAGCESGRGRAFRFMTHALRRRPRCASSSSFERAVPVRIQG